MDFSVRPVIRSCESLSAFFAHRQLCESDLIITNDYLLAPHTGGQPLPCTVLYQEQYGRGEPSDLMVDAMLAAVRGVELRRIIAIGGGTVIDIAKLFVFGGVYDCEALFARGATLPKTRELIIVPTTCGTGSEVTGISIVELTKRGTKLGLAVPALYADEAVLIPSLLDTLPYEVFATSSLDALIHAAESTVSPRASALSRAMGAGALRDILQGYAAMNGRRALPADMETFLTASTMAGIAFANAGCAAVHALSYPVGALYHVPHGKANYMLFEAVLAKYRTLGADLSALETVLGEVLGCHVREATAVMFALLGSIYDRQTLGSLGCDAARCRAMAADVVASQQRLLANSPVTLTEEHICDIYKQCL